MSPLMREAMSREDWERMDKGLPLKKAKKEVRPDPEPPEVERKLIFADIPQDRFDKLLNASMRRVSNKDGVRFLGYDVEIALKPLKPKAKKPLEVIMEEQGSNIINGWMPESEWMLFVRSMRTKIDWNVVQL